MKVYGLDDREYVFNLKKLSRKVHKLSSHHKQAIEIIESITSAPIYNEVTLPGCKGVAGGVLCADIFLPSLGVIIEVHGKQHYEFSEHFHKTKAKFVEYIQNDRRKADWCEINEMKFIELKYDESDQWAEQLKSKLYE